MMILIRFKTSKDWLLNFAVKLALQVPQSSKTTQSKRLQSSFNHSLCLGHEKNDCPYLLMSCNDSDFDRRWFFEWPCLVWLWLLPWEGGTIVIEFRVAAEPEPIPAATGSERWGENLYSTTQMSYATPYFFVDALIYETCANINGNPAYNRKTITEFEQFQGAMKVFFNEPSQTSFLVVYLSNVQE